MHVTGSSYAWFIFNLNIKHCYARIVYYSVYKWNMVPHQPCPLLLTTHSLYLTPLFYLLGDPAFLLVVWIPIHFCPWFAINCSHFAASPTPTHPDTPHGSSYSTYIDDINSISRPVWYTLDERIQRKISCKFILKGKENARKKPEWHSPSLGKRKGKTEPRVGTSFVQCAPIKWIQKIKEFKNKKKSGADEVHPVS